MEIKKPHITSIKVTKFTCIENNNKLANEKIKKFLKEEQVRQNESLIRASRFRAN